MINTGTKQDIETQKGSGPLQVDTPVMRNTARNALLMVTSTVIVAVLNYVLNIILGWTLPIEDYGRVGVSQTLIFICVWFLAAGFPWVVARAIAQVRDAGPLDGEEGAAAWRTYKTAWLANTVLTFLVVGILLAAYMLGWLPLNEAYAPLIAMVALTVIALGSGAVPNAGLQGLFRFARISVVRITEALTNIMVSVTLVLLGFGAPGALAGFAISAGLVAGLNTWFMRDKRFWLAKGWGGLGSVGDALPITLAVFGGVLLTNIDLLAIKFLTGQPNSDALSGTYQVAAVLARGPFYVGTALVSTFYPRIAQDKSESGSIAVGSGRELLHWLAVIVLPMNVIMIAGAPALVRFFFPEHYAPAAGSLAVLGLGSAFLIFAGAFSSILQAMHRTKGPAIIMSLAVAVQVTGLLWLVPAMGIRGAALASTLASGLACALLLTYVKRAQPGLEPPRLKWQVLALLLLGGLTLPLTLQFAEAGRVVVAGWVAIALALYLSVCFFFNLLNAQSLFAPLMRFSFSARLARPIFSLASSLNRLGRNL